MKAKGDTETTDSLPNGMHRTFKLLQAFDKLGYATDPYLGNLTVSPLNLGTAMQIWCKIKHQNGNTIDKNLRNIVVLERFIKYDKVEHDGTEECDHILQTK